MTQRNAKIKDALKTEYCDFVDFCVSLDKQFVSELTTSDFIAFRTQHGATRDYVASIRRTLDSYDPATEELQGESQLVVAVDEHYTVTEDPTTQCILDETEKENALDPSESEEEKSTINVSEAVKQETVEESSMIISVADDHAILDETAEKRSFSSGKAWFNYMEELRSMDVKLPLYDLFGIPRDPIFASRDVVELGMTVRPYNCLINNRCKTLDALLDKSLREISQFANMGKKSLLEIVNKCKEIADDPKTILKGASAETTALNVPAVKANEKLLTIAESIALGIEYDVSDLCPEEKRFAHLLENAYQVLGEELCLMALDEPEKARNLCSMLSDFVERHETLSQIAQIVNHIENHGISLQLHVMPFVAAMKKTKFDLGMVFSSDDRFADVPTAVEKYLESDPANKASRRLKIDLQGLKYQTIISCKGL